MSDRVVLWDFDGTLAFRPGMWSGCMIEVLDEHERDHGVSLEAARAAIRGGFPWHAWEQSHPRLCEADAWHEKPHPEAFRLALRACGDPGRAWMVGDNPEADVRGAEALGLPAILVRVPGEARRRAERLEQAAEMIVAGAALTTPNP